ncbi:hypothetical protein QBC43DRAFT_353483 [Cladorrhinum sp. PSN259]|nr:hypothetical protein QBC43DRAFT_353483 [Cladorrhinum sp. PSN259]
MELEVVAAVLRETDPVPGGKVAVVEFVPEDGDPEPLGPTVELTLLCGYGGRLERMLVVDPDTPVPDESAVPGELLLRVEFGIGYGAELTDRTVAVVETPELKGEDTVPYALIVVFDNGKGGELDTVEIPVPEYVMPEPIGPVEKLEFAVGKGRRLDETWGGTVTSPVPDEDGTLLERAEVAVGPLVVVTFVKGYGAELISEVPVEGCPVPGIDEVLVDDNEKFVVPVVISLAVVEFGNGYGSEDGLDGRIDGPDQKDEDAPVGPAPDVEFGSGNGAVVKNDEDEVLVRVRDVGREVTELPVPGLLPKGATVEELDAGYGGEDCVLLGKVEIPVDVVVLSLGAGVVEDPTLPVPGRVPLEVGKLVELPVGYGTETVGPEEVMADPGANDPELPVPGRPPVGVGGRVELPVGYGAEVMLPKGPTGEVDAGRPELPGPGMLPVPLTVGPVEFVPGNGGVADWEMLPPGVVDVVVTEAPELPVPGKPPVDGESDVELFAGYGGDTVPLGADKDEIPVPENTEAVLKVCEIVEEVRLLGVVTPVE